MTLAPEKCENCGRSIGKLEVNYLWQSHVVCAQCHQALSVIGPQRPLSYAAPVAPQKDPKLPPVVTERTSKRWKMHMLCGAMTAIAGVFFMCANMPGKFGPGAGMTVGELGALCFLGGIAWAITARMLAWWHHG